MKLSFVADLITENTAEKFGGNASDIEIARLASRLTDAGQRDKALSLMLGYPSASAIYGYICGICSAGNTLQENYDYKRKA